MEFDGVKIFDTRKHQADGGEIQQFLSHFDIDTDIDRDFHIHFKV